MANAVEAGGSNGHYGGGGGPGGGRLPRLPRWTRQEILVLIQGKRVVESRGRVRGRGGGGVGRSGEEGAAAAVVAAGPVEPKWVSVSSYCGRRGVNRGPVQCRKRWSNLAGDFKKIKEWEGKGKESFWTMRNDVRRERRLPGFFDREVYDILDGAALPEPEAETAEEDEGKKKGDRRTPSSAVDEEEAVFDSGRTAAGDGLFSDLEEDKEAEEEEEEDPAPPPQPVAAVPISEKEWESTEQGRSDSGQATPKNNQEEEEEEDEDDNDGDDDDIPEKGSPSHSHQGQKRRRTWPEAAAEDSDLQLQGRLIEVLERNSRMLTAQLEAQNLNCQLDRDLRKDQAKSLLDVLGKLADALGKIADKL
ncbi:trihelix transcription factor ASR3-like [Zingiber officinale]|uniref:trihelix transcription factor ASR3-like n=1 Tax=Zingiber officinale TaxID=94328 RepID=UPI001C4B9D22|nr:trihelix transcription factor ASR3-like [Zingiber officinale]